jgi:hypothetical protein
MVTRVLLTLAIIVVAASAECCPAPNVDYCPSTAFLGTTDSATCTSFGTGHVHTFDGAIYDFHEYGDFWLLAGKGGAALPLNVQVRSLDCQTQATQTVPTTATTTVRATCNRAFAFKGPGANQSLEITHDLNSQNLDVSFGYATQPVQNSYTFAVQNGGTFSLSVRPIKYVNPYSATALDKKPYLQNADFYVMFTYTSALFTGQITATLIFYNTGAATIMLTIPSSALAQFNARTAGLCGFMDGCAANDLYLRPTPVFNAPVDATRNAQPYIATVTAAGLTEGRVSAGSLIANDFFINNTNTPSKWAAYFGVNWRVGLSERQFQNDGNNYNIRHIATTYSSSISNCAASYFPNGAPDFLLQECGADRSYFNNPDGYDVLASVHVLFTYCNTYCESGGVFPLRNRGLQAYHCTGVCQTPSDPTEDIHGPFSEWNLPTYDNSQPFDRPDVLFTPDLGLAGAYWFQFQAQDYCQNRLFNVTKTISCSNSLSVTLPQIRYIARSNKYDYPIAQIQATQPSGAVRLSWKFLDWPNSATSAPPTILFDTSASPFVDFVGFVPGNYTLEYAVYDGCQIGRRNFTIVLQCSSCVAPALIDLNEIKEVIWGMNFDNAETGPVNAGVRAYTAKEMNSIDHAADAPAWSAVSHNWTIISAMDSLDVITDAGIAPPNKMFNIGRYPDQTVADFGMAYPNGMIFNQSSAGPFVDFSATLLPVVTTPLFLSPLPGLFGTQYGVDPPQRAFPITRAGTQTINSRVTQTSMTNTTVWKFAVVNTVCTLTLTPGNGQQTSAQFNPIAANPFLAGQMCVGEYGVELDVSEDRCNISTDVQLLQAECGPNPLVIVNCQEKVPFNYNTGLFPTVTIDASLSRDPYARTLRYLYTYAMVPSGSARTGGPTCPTFDPQGQCTAPVVNFTPDIPGDYAVQVEASNGCNEGVDTVYVEAYCPANSSTLTASFTTSVPTVNFAGTLLSLTVGLDGSATNSIVAPPARLGYQYSTVNDPTNPAIGYAASPFFSNPNIQSPTVRFGYAGTYTIVLNVTQGCGQYSQAQRQIQVVCDASINAGITMTAPFSSSANNVTITWDPAILPTGGWPLVTLDSAPLTTFQFVNNPTPAQGTQNFIWAGPLTNVSAPILNFNKPGLAFGGGSYNITLIATDLCVYSTRMITINYRCNALTPSVTVTPTGTIPSGTTVNLDASGTIGATNFLWTLLSAPAGNAAIITNANTGTPQITPVVTGTYYIQVQVGDGCQFQYANVSFTVSCPFPLTPVPSASSTNVAWNANAFPRVELNGQGSNIGSRPNGAAGISWTWQIQGPMYSVYYAPKGLTTFTYSNVTVNSTTSDGNYTYFTSIYNMTTLQTVQDYTVIIPNEAPFGQSNFAACFYPDVAGAYSLTLILSDGCQTNNASFTVNANCPQSTAPNIQAAVLPRLSTSSDPNATQPNYVSQNLTAGSQDWLITLTRGSPRRLRLDASNSTSNSNSKLSFYWAWRYPDPRWNTSEAQDDIDSPYSSTAELVLPGVGDYYILLTVHDGCAVNQLNITLHASCDSTPRTPNFGNRTTIGSNGRSSVTIELENTQVEKDGSNQFSCDFVTDWTFYNFTERSPTGVNVVPQPPGSTSTSTTFVESVGNMIKRWLS